MISERLDVPFYLVVTSSAKKYVINPPDIPLMRGFKYINVENRGRDILPFIRALDSVDFDFDVGIKLHTKKSPHRADGDIWRNALLNDLIPRGGVGRILSLFQRDVNLGFVSPMGHYVRVADYIGSNEKAMASLASKLGIEITATDINLRRFIAGSMFWFRKLALADWTFDATEGAFEKESGQLDGTAAHAAERLFSIAGERRAYLSIAVEDMNSFEGELGRHKYPLAHRLSMFSDQRLGLAAVNSSNAEIALSRVDFHKQNLRAWVARHAFQSSLARWIFRGLSPTWRRRLKRIAGMRV